MPNLVRFDQVIEQKSEEAKKRTDVNLRITQHLTTATQSLWCLKRYGAHKVYKIRVNVSQNMSYILVTHV